MVQTWWKIFLLAAQTDIARTKRHTGKDLPPFIRKGCYSIQGGLVCGAIRADLGLFSRAELSFLQKKRDLNITHYKKTKISKYN
ncbi:MAG: hypothetical protein WAJ89_03610, partial [Methanoregula sp.]